MTPSDSQNPRCLLVGRGREGLTKPTRDNSGLFITCVPGLPFGGWATLESLVPSRVSEEGRGWGGTKGTGGRLRRSGKEEDEKGGVGRGGTGKGFENTVFVPVVYPLAYPPSPVLLTCFVPLCFTGFYRDLRCPDNLFLRPCTIPQTARVSETLEP